LVADEGALDYVLAARVEAAVRLAFPETAALTPHIRRTPSAQDAPRRSRLYAPGNSPRILVGIELHGADIVLVDLEDSVPPAEKPAARVLVKHLLSAIDFPNEVWVRINPLSLGGARVRDHSGSTARVALPKADRGRRALAQLARAEAAGVRWDLDHAHPRDRQASSTPRDRPPICASSLSRSGPRFHARRGARRHRRPLRSLDARRRGEGGRRAGVGYGLRRCGRRVGPQKQGARDLGFDGKGAIHRALVPARRVRRV
jgi:hypothetical protein